MTETPEDKNELPWADQQTVLREVDLRAAGAVPKSLKRTGLRKSGGLSALAILKAGSSTDLKVKSAESAGQTTEGSQSKDEQSAAQSVRKRNSGVRKWMIRRIRRLWSNWVMKLLDMKFPTLFAHLPAKKKEEIRALLQPGDILLEDNSTYLLSQFGARILHSTWSHSGVYIGAGQVIDCGSRPYVAEIGLDEFLNTSDIAVYRPRYETAQDLDAALSFLKSCIDRPFNRNFKLTSENSFYCTQLIYRALKQMPSPINLAVSTVMEKSVILASAVESCPQMQLIWISRNGFLKGCLTHLPSVFAAALGGYLMNLLCPPLVILGGVLGLTAILTAENLYQSDTRPKKSMSKDRSHGKNRKPSVTPKETRL